MRVHKRRSHYDRCSIYTYASRTLHANETLCVARPINNAFSLKNRLPPTVPIAAVSGCATVRALQCYTLLLYHIEIIISRYLIA